MTLKEIIRILNCQVLTEHEELDIEINRGCGCDLMSDVLSFIKPGALLLTGLNNPQAIRTAEMSEVKAICLVRDKQPSEEMISLANENGIILLATSLPMFEACGKLYKNGLLGHSEYKELS